VVDRGGPSTNDGSFATSDYIRVYPGKPLGSCSSLPPQEEAPPFEGFLASGDIVVHDALPLPTSKDQCKSGGWRGFGVFRNQGDCVNFVASKGKNPPGAG
jgi:hypothetical protein